MNDEGWVKIHRRLRKHPIYKDSHAVHLFIELLMLAEMAERTVAYGAKLKILKRGEVLTTASELIAATGLSRQMVRTSLNKLKINQLINLDANQRGMVVTIENYAKYQDNKKTPNQRSNQHSNQRLTNVQPAPNQRLTNAVPNDQIRPLAAQGFDPSISIDMNLRREEGKKERRVSHTPKLAPAGADMLSKVWAEECPNLAQPKKINPTRMRHIKARLAEDSDEDYWRSVAQRIARSDFCTGGGNTGWRADFDWFVREGTHLKVSEGKYDDKAITPKAPVIEPWRFEDEEGAMQ